MRVSKGAIVRAFSIGRAPAQPYVRTSSSRNGTEDSALDHARGVRQKSRRLQRDDQTIARGVGTHPVQTRRNMKGVQPFACI